MIAQIVKIGDTVWTWCSRCMTRQEKRFTGAGLVCLGCEEREHGSSLPQDARVRDLTESYRKI